MSQVNAGRPGGTARKAWAALLILASFLPGFVLGAWLGARLLVPNDAGLAGGAMVFWYGVLGMLVAVGCAWTAVRRLPPNRLKLAALLAAAVALTALAVLLLLFHMQAGEHAELQNSGPMRLLSGHAPATVRG